MKTALDRLNEEKIFSKLDSTPLLILRAGQDKTVCNVKINEMFETVPIKDKQMITYDDADHCIQVDN